MICSEESMPPAEKIRKTGFLGSAVSAFCGVTPAVQTGAIAKEVSSRLMPTVASEE